MNYQEHEQLLNIKREIEMWKKINNHSNIIRLFDFEIHESFVLILMELASEGTLLEMINNRVEAEIGENVALYIIREITLGILHMHSQSPPIAHRDIKIENVLRVGNSYKLCDFGSTSIDTLDPRKESKSTVLENFSKFEKMTTFIYRPPEMCDPYSKFPICEKVDIWMLGCILFAILFKTHPFLDAQKLTIINAHYYIPENNYSEKIIDFMRLMLTPNPVNRPSARDVLNIIADWKNIKMIELPSETKEIKSKHLKNAKSNNVKSNMLTADDIYRVQQEIMKEQMKKNRFKRKNDENDDGDLNEIFDDLDVGGDSKNVKDGKDGRSVNRDVNRDAGSGKNGSPSKDKLKAGGNLIVGNANNTSKPFEGFDKFDAFGSGGNVGSSGNKAASADWMINFNQGFGNNSNAAVNKNSNFDNNFGFDFLDDTSGAGNNNSNTVKKTDTFGDLDNVFSSMGSGNTSGNASTNTNLKANTNVNTNINTNNKSKSNNEIPNIHNTSNNHNNNNFNVTFGNNFANKTNNHAGGFDFDKFNSSSSNQFNKQGFTGNNNTNITSTGNNSNNFNVTFGNNFGNSQGNNFGNTFGHSPNNNSFNNNDPFFGNAFSNNKGNNNNTFNNQNNNAFNNHTSRSKSPINTNTQSKLNNSNNNISPNTARTPPSNNQNLGQKQGVNISQPKGEQNILDFFK
jgi:serine/threonine protein kinase